MYFRVLTKRQALSVLIGVILLTAAAASGIVMLVVSAPQESAEAVAVFAGSDMLFSVEAMTTQSPDTPAPAPSIAPQETPASADRTFRVEVVRDTPVPTSAEGKRILIYHSHTWEAFEQVEDMPYEETEKWRTKDNRCNMVAVGEALANQLRALGCTVVHDTTAFEPPQLDSAYTRSLTMLEERAALGEEYDLYIDLHRDAISASSTIKRTVNIGGVDVARFMMLIGKGTGSGFDVKPDWEANLAIAQQITDLLNGMADGLCRDVKIKTGRFNQHIAPRCVLIECGNNLNTLEEVLNGIPYLAEAIVDTLKNPG